MDTSPNLDDLLDQLVSEYSDERQRGRNPARAGFLERVPAAARPGLERVLKMIDAGMAQTPSAMEPLGPGVELGHYRLEHEVGRGGMAVVWLAHDRELKRPVALKVLRPGLALEQRHVDRFRREALAIASLTHPHIVQVHGVGEDRGYHWLAMEYVEGPSLATVLEALPDRGRTAEELARAAGIAELAQRGGDFERALATLLAPVADALAQAHQHGLVHRDVKPSNILIHRDGRAVIADFGLAKGDRDPALSLTGEGLGTPYYMSPEQAFVSGRSVDHRTDIYSLGVTMYEALTGVRPFQGEGYLQVLDAIRNNIPPSVRSLAPERSKDVAAIVRYSMAREPDKRYASAAELADDLRELSRGRAPAARQREGGALARAWTQMRLVVSGAPYEYRSARKLFGLPLVHWVSGVRAPGTPPRVARGWLACGDVAYGAIAMGNRAVGVVAMGGITVGVAVWGGISAGLIGIGGITTGLLAIGGIGLGWLAFGGIVTGYAAIGGISLGRYTEGGMPLGTYRMGAVQDPEAVDFFERLFESWSGFFAALFG